MTQRRSSQLTIGFSPDFVRQSAWDVPLLNAVLNKAFPAVSKNYLDIDETSEDITDCTGEDFLFELITARIARLSIDMDMDPEIFAGMVAACYGTAAAPSGGTSEVQTETVSATSGSRTLTVMIGANAQTTSDLEFDDDAATIQAALEALSNVGAGDVVVTGTGPYVYTFASNLATQDVNLIEVGTFKLVGGTSVMAVTTPGIGKSHAISRTTGYTLPLLTFHIGFRGSDQQPVVFKNVVVDSVEASSQTREKVSARIELIGSADLQQSTAYTMPECLDIVPIRFGDCKMTVGGTDYIAANLGREFRYYFQNDVNPQYDGSGIDSTRHERADIRPSGMDMFILGEPNDSVYNIGKNKVTLPSSIQCGPDGRMIKFNVPAGLHKLAQTPIRFGGDPLESEVSLVVRPKKISGDSTTPTNVVAVNGISATYLTSA